MSSPEPSSQEPSWAGAKITSFAGLAQDASTIAAPSRYTSITTITVSPFSTLNFKNVPKMTASASQTTHLSPINSRAAAADKTLDSEHSPARNVSFSKVSFMKRGHSFNKSLRKARGKLSKGKSVKFD